MAFLRNTWYVAAYPEDLQRSLFPRQVIGEHLVFFRREDGTPAALQDTCPHRLAPLSRGQLIGDRIECPYHGLQFDSTGQCVLNPHPPGSIPVRMVVRRYPVVERHALIWVWMGDPDKADADRIPDLAYLSDSARWRTIRNYFHLPFAADLMVDNLMDMSHVEYVHKGSISGGYQEGMQTKMTVEEHGDCVRVNMLVRNFAPGVVSKATSDPGPLADSYRDTVWEPPGIMRNELTDVKPGQPREEGRLRFHTHCLTPETHRSMHDFALRSRNFALDDEAMDRRLLGSQRPVVVEEDGALLSRIQDHMGDAPFESLGPVMFHVDTGAVRVRRVMERLIRAEAAPNNSKEKVNEDRA